MRPSKTIFALCILFVGLSISSCNNHLCDAYSSNYEDEYMNDQKNEQSINNNNKAELEKT